MIRIFVAIDLPDSAKDCLRDVGENLRRQVPDSSVRWTRVPGIHLTLKFLGNVDEADLPAISEALLRISRRHMPFTFAIGGLGCFPNVKRPRVVWVGITEESGTLLKLQQDVEDSLVPLGFKKESRAFHPHLTLGRAQRHVTSSEQRRLGEIVSETAIGELVKVYVDSFRLMRSDLRPEGAVYASLRAFPLLFEQSNA